MRQLLKYVFRVRNYLSNSVFEYVCWAYDLKSAMAMYENDKLSTWVHLGVAYDC